MEDTQGERGPRGSRGERGERGDDAVLGLSIDEQRDLIKSAVREWMDDCFAAFGKWSAAGLLAAAIGGAITLFIAHTPH